MPAKGMRSHEQNYDCLRTNCVFHEEDELLRETAQKKYTFLKKERGLMTPDPELEVFTSFARMCSQLLFPVFLRKVTR